MLQGLDVDEEQSGRTDKALETQLAVIYEDSSLLVVSKPSGLLSVPGRTDAPSVQSLLAQRYGSVFLPHRLDMDTSGLLVVARTEAVYKALQQQFYARTVEKRYLALVSGRMPVGQCGTISLPLRPDPLDRPRQVVDPLHGKAATTDYEVLPLSALSSLSVFGLSSLHSESYSLIALTPHTGRTHQLRVHCAHPDGLGMPIVGDALYGQKAHRLCLHAAELSFTHPVSGERLHFTCYVGFG
jgi:tRNA pseudouridine32 synthase/23S rRNA pseudouridine746 synthase